MIIRPLSTQDKEKISELLWSTDTFNQMEIRVAIELIDETLSYPERQDYQIFCAFDGGGELAGYICFGPVPMTNGCYDLYWIAVDEKFSRRGVGRGLLQYMEDIVKGKKARHIYIDTSSTPPYEAARSFYEKCGYKPVCVLRDFYRVGDHKMIFMKEINRAETPYS
ncbi:MAG: GNAT family N-acetyltransferase [Pseudomonadota bacterium]